MSESKFYSCEGDPDEINITESGVTINIGLSTVTIDKLFGPTIAASLRLRVDVDKGVWVIEREDIHTQEFIEYITIPLQNKLDWRDEDKETE